MAKKYVDLDDVLNELFNLYDSISPNTITGNDARNKIFKSYKTIENLSNKDVQEVRHGEWIYGEYDIPHCSRCGKEVMPCNISKYCPNCGCKMDGGENNDREIL